MLMGSEKALTIADSWKAVDDTITSIVDKVVYQVGSIKDLLELMMALRGIATPGAFEMDQGVKAVLESKREFMPPPGVLLSLCKIPPRFTGDGIPLVEETRRLQLQSVTCDYHRGEGWYSDDPPPEPLATCPKCRELRLLPEAPTTKKLGPK
jgi:hypothetical protein